MNNTEFKLAVIEAIDKTVAQGQLGRGVRGYCAYTTANYDGNEICCPVGHMMPDVDTRRLADSWDDGGSIGIASLHQDGFPWAEQFTEGQILLMVSLQGVHDDCNTTVSTFKALCSKVYDWFS